jgi:hypothetical protein
MSVAQALRQSGTLTTGVVVEGVVHRDFELRLPTVQDNIDAVDLVGTTNGVALNAAILASQLVKLGSLAPAQIDYELFIQLHPSDFNVLEAAASELEKKRVLAARALPTGTASGSPL